VKNDLIAHWLRFAARYPVFWIALTASCLLALVLLITLLLWSGTQSVQVSTPQVQQGFKGQTHPNKEKQSSPPLKEYTCLLPNERAPDRGGLAIVIDDLGENMQAINALLSLRIPLTFAIWPHARLAREAAKAGHDAGCTIIIHQPMEAFASKANPGPNPLRVGMSRNSMEAIVKQNREHVPYAEGLNNHMGSRFTSQPKEVRMLCNIIEDCGLFILDSVTYPASVLYREAKDAGIAAVRRDIFLDDKKEKNAVLAQLREATRRASRGKQIIAIGHPHTETLAALREWNSSRDPALHLMSLRDCLATP